MTRSHRDLSAPPRPVRGRLRVSALALTAGLLGALALSGRAPAYVAGAAPEGRDADDTKEYKLKAAFLYNFAKYCTWPKGTFEKDDSPLVIGLVGEDPFGSILEKALDDKKVEKHPLRYRVFERVRDLEDVHLLFVGQLSKKERVRLEDWLEDSHVLVVEDEAGNVGAGAHLGFYLEEGKIRFAASTKALEASDLSLSSQLLKLAKIVDKD